MKPVPVTFDGNVAAYLAMHLQEMLESGELPAVSQDYLGRASATLEEAMSGPVRSLPDVCLGSEQSVLPRSRKQR